MELLSSGLKPKFIQGHPQSSSTHQKPFWNGEKTRFRSLRNRLKHEEALFAGYSTTHIWLVEPHLENTFDFQGRIFRVPALSRSFRESPLCQLERVQCPSRWYLKSSSRKVALFNVKAYIIYSTIDGFWARLRTWSERMWHHWNNEKTLLPLLFIEKSLINLPLEFLDPKRIKSCVGTLDTRLGANY